MNEKRFLNISFYRTAITSEYMRSLIGKCWNSFLVIIFRVQIIKLYRKLFYTNKFVHMFVCCSRLQDTHTRTMDRIEIIGHINNQ